MTTRFRQTAPPSPYDVKFAMLAGSHGSIPFIYRDRDPTASHRRTKRRSPLSVFVSGVFQKLINVTQFFRESDERSFVQAQCRVVTQGLDRTQIRTTARCCP